MCFWGYSYCDSRDIDKKYDLYGHQDTKFRYNKETQTDTLILSTSLERELNLRSNVGIFKKIGQKVPEFSQNAEILRKYKNMSKKVLTPYASTPPPF